MKLFRISQSINNDYDTYDAAIVAAHNDQEAREIHPCGDTLKDCNDRRFTWNVSTWCKPENVQVKYIGEAELGTEVGVILASFNAG